MRAHENCDQLAAEGIKNAQRLAGAVRDSLQDIAAVTDPLDRDQLVALSVALAAMVDVDKPVSELLAWLEPPAPAPAGVRYPELTTDEALRMAHAAHVRGERHPWAIEGERRYQAAKYQIRKVQRAAQTRPGEAA